MKEIVFHCEVEEFSITVTFVIEKYGGFVYHTNY